jgi:hypothetical protein
MIHLTIAEWWDLRGAMKPHSGTSENVARNLADGVRQEPAAQRRQKEHDPI